MTRSAAIVCCLLAVGVQTPPIRAQNAGDARPETDKRVFHFLNPTPVELLREMTTDGPGATESPYTVDAGHFQIEMAFVDYTSETFREPFWEDGFLYNYKYRLDWLAVAPMNLKAGLLNSLDLQLLLEPYHHVYEREEVSYEAEKEVTRKTRESFGDMTIRLKYNLWGNDRGKTAGAVMPFVKVPTSHGGVGSDVVEGGLILPFAAELPWGFGFGLTSRFSVVQDILEGSGRHVEFGNSLELSHQIIGDLDGYAEFFSNVSTEKDVGWVGRFGTGLIYWLTDDLQLNAGANVGLTKWADDWNFFAGFAWRY